MSKPKATLRSPSSRIACAIYTRKSSEEGIEQDFNSLDAQREACESYVQSQKAEGWQAVPALYNDGGFTGGNLERPALRHLMADIADRRIKIVVVYKVDRLTRSLADFAKLVELFDAHGVSFVSVTQQFNTTSFMGRLTLNVLLSFAQFEREITGERIRDKIAASKAKGMWMGGNPPMGYIPHDRTLEIDESAAQKVREIFNIYITLGCVSKVKDEVDRLGWKTQTRIGQKSGVARGNRSFSRGHLYRILTSPLYIGQITHRGMVYPGQHLGIIEQGVWDAVQARLSGNRQGNRQRIGAQSLSLLAGLVWDDQQDRLTPSHSKKGERRYRYYISNRLLQQSREEAPDALRIPANELEGVVIQALREFLRQDSALFSLLEERGIHQAHQVQPILKRARSWAQMIDEPTAPPSGQPGADNQSRLVVLQALIQGIVVGREAVQISVRVNALLDGTKELGQPTPPSIADEGQDLHLLSVPIQLKRSGMAMRLMVPGEMRERGADSRLIQLLAKGHDWFERLTSGKARSLMEIAEKDGVDSNYVTRVINLSFLAPDIIKAIIEGRQPTTVTADTIMDQFPLPIDWADQRKLLGFRH